MEYDNIIMNQPNLNRRIQENLLETIEEKEQQLRSRYLMFYEVYNPMNHEINYQSKLVRVDNDGENTPIMIFKRVEMTPNCIERCLVVEPASSYFTTQDFTIVPKENNQISLKWRTRQPLRQFHKDQLTYLKNPMKRIVLNRDKGIR